MRKQILPQEISTKYGKEIDIRRLKISILKNPWDHLGKIKIQRELFESDDNTFEVKKCDICKSTCFEKALSLSPKIVYFQCADCNHAFLKRRLKENIISAYYKKSSLYSSTYCDPELYAYRKKFVAQPKVEYVLSFLKKTGRSIRWLDIGSASGEVVSVLGEHGVECIGLEPSEHSREFATKYYGITLCSDPLEIFAQKQKQQFDVISFFGVLEHLPNPMEALRITSLLLVPNGMMAVDVPNFNSFSTRVQSAFPENIMRHAEPMGHMMLFTTTSLEKAFCLSGLAPVGVWYFGMDMHELFLNLSLQDPNFNESRLKQEIYEQLNALQIIIDRAQLSDEFLMVATKSH